MNLIRSSLKEGNLRDSDQGSKECMICKKHIIKINLPSLLVIDKIPFGVINGVEEKASKIHCHKIEVHTLNTMMITKITS